MAFDFIRHAARALAIAIVLGVATSQGHGEIAVAGDQTPAKVAPPTDMTVIANEPVIGEASMRVQCWQYGVKIIDEKDVFSIRLRNLIDRDSLGFKGRNSNNGDLYVIPVNGDSTCLIKPMR